MTAGQWAKHVKAQRASDSTRAKYCAAHGLNRSTFDYHAKRVSGAGESEGQFVPVGSGGCEPIEVIIGRAVLRVKPGSDLSELRRIVEALS